MNTPSAGFDALTLAAVAEEMRLALVGARVQKIRQPDATTILLQCYGRAKAQMVLLCADPKEFRAHLSHIRREGPIHPPLFCQMCRKYLTHAKVEDVYLPQLDRILHLTFVTTDGERTRLIAELMGRNTNVALVSGAGILRAVLRPTTPDTAQTERALRPGTAYSDPPGYEEKVNPLDVLNPADAIFHECPTDTEAVRDWLTATFSGINRFAAGEILARAASAGSVPAAFCALLDRVRAGQFDPHSIVDAEGQTVAVWAFEPLTVPPARRFRRDSISVALETLYATLTRRNRVEDERKVLRRAIARETQFRQKELVSVKATLAEAGRADRYEELGNNLLAALYRLEKGKASVLVPDLYSETGAEIEIPLDPKKSPQENAESYFIRARKSREAATYAETKAAERAVELVTLHALAERLEAADTPEELATLRTELTALIGAERLSTAGGETKRTRPRTPVKPFSGFRIRSYTVEGYTLLVGESAEANDYLTTKVAAPTDYWFHVRNVPGPHGVLRTGGNPARIPQAVLYRCAEIVAARTAHEKHSNTVPVDVTEKRYVRKPRGAKPGLVRIERERTLDVTPRL